MPRDVFAAPERKRGVRARRWVPGFVLLAAVGWLAIAGMSPSSSRASSDRSCRWRAAPADDPHPRLFDRFNSVTVTPSGSAWAVGDYYTGHEGGPHGSFIEEWTGQRWHLVGRPQPNAELWSVSASSPDDAWAVGDHLLERWDGTRWHRVATARVQGNILWGTATHSPTEAWLVGERWRGQHRNGKTLAERWNGSRWSVVPTPNPASGRHRYDAILQAMSVRSDSDAWAVGYWLTGPHMLVSRTLIEHWDGRRWRIVPSPSVRASNGVLYDILFAVAADGSNDAWAVGSYESHAGGYGGGGEHALVLHWNGKRWSRASLPPSRERTFLHGVVTQAGGAWAVGDRGLPPNHHRTLIEHWDGSSWTAAPSPHGFDLSAVSAPPHGTAWTVGAIGRSPLAAQLVCSHG
jgi:hypothetical protein